MSTDPLMVAAQKDAAEEIQLGLVELVRKVKRFHGPDPELPMIVMAALGQAVDDLGLRSHKAAAALGSMLVENWERDTGEKFRSP